MFMRVVAGPSSIELAKKLSGLLNVPLAKAKTKRFPDGEFYFKFEEKITGEDLLIVQSLYPPQDRQDERYLAGEGVSAAMVAQLLKDLGVKALYTIDVHNGNVLKRYRIPVFNLTAAGELAKYFTSKGLKNAFVVSPDDEEMAIKRVEHAARTISADYDYFKKTRDHYTGEIETFSKQLDVHGRDVIIIDDIISTSMSLLRCRLLPFWHKH